MASTPARFSSRALEVSDAFANRFSGERGGPRYVIQQTVMVRSRSPEVVIAASQRVSELVGAGVKEATANARAAAEQFAADSRSDLAGIRQANQGVFVILPRDQAPGINEGAQLLSFPLYSPPPVSVTPL
jgi:hypothetical protein